MNIFCRISYFNMNSYADRLVGQSVCHNFLKRREGYSYYQSICLIPILTVLFPFLMMVFIATSNIFLTFDIATLKYCNFVRDFLNIIAHS